MNILAALILFTVPNIYVARVSGVINPVTSSYLVASIDRAEREGAQCLIIELDTPGGLDESMRDIVKKMLNAEVPIVVYVFPKGGRAASAGAFITLAAHVAAMAPGTNIGAAHPVNLGGQQVDSVMKDKITNDAAAYIVSIAQERGRNEKWAEDAVRKSISTAADEALKLKVIDLVAESEEKLIEKLNGLKVKLREVLVTITTEGGEVVRMNMSLRDQLLLTITNPNITYILLILGLYGLIFELQNPGAVFPGVVGGICLVLAFYAMHVLPVNYAGVALIVLGIIFFTLELYATSHGLLGAGGVVSLLLGSLMLFKSDIPFLKVSLEVIMTVLVITVLFFVILLAFGLKAQFRKPVTGREGIVGETGVAKTGIDRKQGTVLVHGELWEARSETTVASGEQVKIVKVEGMVLTVERCGQ
jgi:membrane-bound serine protease (ClpP class)